MTVSQSGKRTFRVALLSAEKPWPGLEQFGDMEQIFRAWFNEIASTYFEGFEIELDNFNVYEGVYPEEPERYDTLCLTGSFNAAFDPEPWILRLADYLRALRDSKRARLMSVCFGHQIVHQALGGEAEINPTGLEEGRLDVKLTQEGNRILKTDKESFAVYLGHRDHVAKLAPGFQLLGSTPQTPIQGSILENRFFTWQVHPEYSADLFVEYLKGMRKEAVEAKEGYSGPSVEQVDKWIDTFYTSPDRKSYAPTDALWIGAKMVSWALGEILSDEELEARAKRKGAGL
ncbi:class I glutamine amidotransferase-like protein [Hyaloraphidium curvatum]|nr:class I glutamine amidotransferase-like protein [Hyaloraphidium curvatum]